MLRGGVALEGVCDLCLGLLRDLRRVTRLRREPPGKDDGQVDPFGQRSQPRDVLTQILRPAVHDAAHAILGGRVHFLDHQVEIRGEWLVWFRGRGDPGGQRIENRQVLVKERRAMCERLGADIPDQGANDGTVGKRQLASLTRRRKKFGQQARRRRGPDGGGSQLSQGVASRARIGSAHNRGLSPGSSRGSGARILSICDHPRADTLAVVLRSEADLNGSVVVRASKQTSSPSRQSAPYPPHSGRQSRPRIPTPRSHIADRCECT